MKIDGVSFNQHWAWGKTEAEFVAEFKDMDHIYPDVSDKVAKLKEAYALLQQGKPADYVAPKAPAAVIADQPKTGVPGKAIQPSAEIPK